MTTSIHLSLNLGQAKEAPKLVPGPDVMNEMPAVDLGENRAFWALVSVCGVLGLFFVIISRRLIRRVVTFVRDGIRLVGEVLHRSLILAWGEC